jgi:hypothetical protein
MVGSGVRLRRRRHRFKCRVHYYGKWFMSVRYAPLMRLARTYNAVITCGKLHNKRSTMRGIRQ